MVAWHQARQLCENLLAYNHSSWHLRKYDTNSGGKKGMAVIHHPFVCVIRGCWDLLTARTGNIQEFIFPLENR